MKELFRSLLRRCGFELVRYRPIEGKPPRLRDLSNQDLAILDKIAPCTMTSVERQAELINACHYLARHKIAGDIVECGVWRGGGCMAAALALIDDRDTDRDIWLYDTFAGMTAPTEADKRAEDGITARTCLESSADKALDTWCVAGLDDVRANMASTGYANERIHYIQGPVETTIPANLPDAPIALLRLDTDWYESTRHELLHLFPLLVDGGIVIIDDYGHWAGARKAVDEYLSGLPKKYFLHRVDYTCRSFVK
ncbi:MAG: TylF/MycF family methyltransferase [Desulfobulbaceae bacterium]|jgi:hypothetical protein|nr:TylF/MycF family methyltransferase [Desulfobulbaceae bacterium]